MSAPKHLWSGDWERDSAALSDDLATLEELPRVTTEPAPEPEPAVPSRLGQAWARLAALRLPRPSRRLQRSAALGLAGLVILAAAAYGLGALLGSAASPGAPSTSALGPPMAWLGMEVEASSPGHVVVATVPPGTAGEQAGLEPGDVIVQINQQAVNSTGDIGKAIAGMHAGQQVQIEVSRGSTLYTTIATLGAAPSHYP